MVKRAAPPMKSGGKRAKGGDDVTNNLELVKDALLNTDYDTPHVPMSVREMLVAGLPEALKVKPENRHAFQDRISQVIKEVLEAMKENLSTTLQEKKDGSATATTEKANLEAAKENLKQELQAKKDDLSAKTDAEVAANEAANNAAAAQVAAEKAAVEAEKAKADEVAYQETLRKVVTEHFAVLKDAPPQSAKESKALLKQLEPHMVKVGVDESLVQSAPAALLKKPEDRKDFDKMVVDHIDTFFQKLQDNGPNTIAAKDADIQAKENAKTARAAEHEAAKNALAAAEEAQQTASAEKKELEKKVREAGKAITDYSRSSAAVFNAVEKAQEMLDGFAEVVESFDWLNGDRKAKVEEEEEAEEPADEAAGQEAEMGEA